VNDKIGVVASFGLPDGEHMHRNTIQIASSPDRADETDSAALAKETGKSANSLTWLKELRPALP
jgi:hypothetical protein